MRRVPWSAFLITVAGILAYSNTFGVPFAFDDMFNILHSQAIHGLSNLGEILAPPRGAAVGGRPVANLSFAVNYAISGKSTWSYHVFNLLAHLVSGLLVFGIVRRTLASEKLRPAFGKASEVLAFFCAFFWTVHPLATEAVTYISQRFESLMGLFFLLTLYLAIRGWESSRPKPWHLAAVLAAILGAGCKEVMAVAPLVVLCYDMVFRDQGPFRALKRSPWLYAGMVLPLLELGLLAAVGATAAVTPKPAWNWTAYLRTQPLVICRYLSLAVWPSNLCFDYNWPVIGTREALPYAAFVLALATASAWAIWRRRATGFLGAWFFLILAPTSSFLPLPFVIWERRMYLPLAAIVALAVAGGFALLQKLSGLLPDKARLIRAVFLCLACLAGVGLMAATYARNEVYTDPVRLWRDTVAKSPLNARAHSNLGVHLALDGQVAEGIAQYHEALALDPNYPEANFNLGCAFLETGRVPRSLPYLIKAVRLQPRWADARIKLGNAFYQAGEVRKAVLQYKAALVADPKSADALSNLGSVFLEKGDVEGAMRYFLAAIKSDPGFLRARTNYGAALLLRGRPMEARIRFLEVLAINPDSVEARLGVADAAAFLGQWEDAEKLYLEALRFAPRRARAHNNLGMVLLQEGKPLEAKKCFQRALAIEPGNAEASRNLEMAEEMIAKMEP